MSQQPCYITLLLTSSWWDFLYVCLGNLIVTLRSMVQWEHLSRYALRKVKEMGVS